MKARLWIGAVALCSACAESPMAPVVPPPVVPACQANHTGTIVVTNHGTDAIDVIWNGAVLASRVGPNQASSDLTVDTVRPSLLDTVRTGTQTLVCSTLSATPSECALTRYGTCIF